MNAMNLQARKLELVQMILKMDRPSLLKKVSQILKQEQKADAKRHNCILANPIF